MSHLRRKGNKEMTFLLVNTNTVKPPVSPVGLEYTGEALVEAGVPVQVLDLSFEADWKSALARELNDSEPTIVGLAVRNTDDCSFVTKRSYLPWIIEVVAEVKRLSQAFILLGGGGFSIMPDTILKLTGVDAGIAGDSEQTAVALTRCITNGEDFSHLPNLIFRIDERIVCNQRVDIDLRYLPAHRRRLFDNKKYEELGAMVGIETKRGCSGQCIYCADPLIKGNRKRLCPPAMVLQEFHSLIAQGVSWFHLCDSEFNLPVGHAKEICLTIIEAGLGDRIRWYTYCSPVPFDSELSSLMKRAGCAGINFGVDSLCDEQLFRLGRNHSESDIRRLVEILKYEGLNYMFDLLIGGPGETEKTIKVTIKKALELDIPLVGISTGVRIYPGTPLGRAIVNGSLEGRIYPQIEKALSEPVFYLSPHLSDDVSLLLNKFVCHDPRFLFLSSPTEDGSYNYADDNALCRLIEQGARGAYWDIIRQNMRISKS